MSARVLTDADVEAIADALAARAPATGGALTVAQVQQRLGVSRDFVYAHKAELGAFRPGGGRGGPLRFPAAEVDAAVHRWRIPAEQPEAARRRPGRPATTRGVKLRPLRDELA